MVDHRGVSKSPTPLLAVDEHRATVAALLAETPVERRPLSECLGLALAEDLTASIPLPPFHNSAMDGYAVRVEDLAGAGTDSAVALLVDEDVPAGRVDNPPLRPGTAHRIMTGAQMPPGADAVVPVELTDGGTEQVRIQREPRPGANVRRAGDDVASGTVVLTAGTSLGASQIGVAAAVGVAELAVHRPPRVLVLSTGSELVAPGIALQPGQIYESNGSMLAAAVRHAGAEARLLRFVPDDVAEFQAELEPHLADTDLVLTSGGVSAGAYEVVKDAFEGQGVEFRQVAVQPGMPQGAGTYRDVAVVTLPGNPVSSMVSFEVFVRSALRGCGGHRARERVRVRASATEAADSPDGKRQFRRGRFDPDSGSVSWAGGPGSHLLAAMATADCLVDLPAATTRVEAGASLDVLLLD